MSISEEKIKALFSDEEKVKQFASDEEFMSKVSEGTATPEMYIEEFRKFGIELSDEDAQEVQKSVAEVLIKSSNELGNLPLENVSGGVDLSPGERMVMGGLVLSGTGLVGSIGCLIASKVYINKTDKIIERATKEGVFTSEDKKQCDKYLDKSIKLSKASAGLVGTSAIPLFSAAIGAGMMVDEMKPKK